MLLQKLNTFGECNLYNRDFAFEWGELELFIDCFQLSAVSLLQLVKNEREKFAEEV